MPKFDYWVTKDGLLLLEGWARDGLVDEQIAHNCGISASTLYSWKNKFPDIAKALRKGKEVVDREIENALIKRAKGYTYVEVKVETELTPDGMPISVKRTEITKHIAPDVTACAILLNNRMPTRYRRNHNKEMLDEDRFKHEKEIESKKIW